MRLLSGAKRCRAAAAHVEAPAYQLAIIECSVDDARDTAFATRGSGVDSRLREQAIGAARQWQLPQLRGCRQAVRRLERGGGAGVFRRSRRNGAIRSSDAWPIAAISSRPGPANLHSSSASAASTWRSVGTAAYSTLGHFDDPILNTMVGWDDVELASIVFHELTHQLAVRLPTTPDVQRGAGHHGGRGGREALAASSKAGTRILRSTASNSSAISKVARTAGGNARPAARDLCDPGSRWKMRAREARGVRAIARRVRGAACDMPGAATRRSRQWFDQDINNAHLASIATYFVCVPGFERELQRRERRSCRRSIARVRELAKIAAESARLICGAR